MHREDSNQTARIRIFTGRIQEIQGCQVSSCRERRLKSDCADAQSDLSLRLAHISGGTLSDIPVNLYMVNILCQLFMTSSSGNERYKCSLQL